MYQTGCSGRNIPDSPNNKRRENSGLVPDEKIIILLIRLNIFKHQFCSDCASSHRLNTKFRQVFFTSFCDFAKIKLHL